MSEFRQDDEESLDLFLDSGLAWYVNTILHPFGLAIGIVMRDEKASGLALLQTNDPDGIIFSDLQYQDGRQKFVDTFVKK